MDVSMPEGFCKFCALHRCVHSADIQNEWRCTTTLGRGRVMIN